MELGRSRAGRHAVAHLQRRSHGVRRAQGMATCRSPSRPAPFALQRTPPTRRGRCSCAAHPVLPPETLSAADGARDSDSAASQHSRMA
jgi:hypothetical protein